MSALRTVALAIWGFLVGDDWRTAIGVSLALALTAILASLGVAAWWVMLVAVPLLLWMSLRRVVRD